nr:MAG TPA: hypothetical protein [Caudoviricetes sp.]
MLGSTVTVALISMDATSIGSSGRTCFGSSFSVSGGMNFMSPSLFTKI